jgi:transposase
MKEKPSITIRAFFQQFPNDEACLAHVFEARFGQGRACPKCERKANWYRIKAERAYSCQWCGHHLHPTAGTPFEDSRTPLQLWFYAIYLFTTSRHGVPAKELERQLGVTYKTAWRMAHHIRMHMENIDGDFPLFGEIEVDETYVGGQRKGPAAKGRSLVNKAVVFGMLQLLRKMSARAPRLIPTSFLPIRTWPRSVTSMPPLTTASGNTSTETVMSTGWKISGSI